ncbi:MAG TPA: SpoIID/LytB domain-containing protein [Solirubrobacteraceae bacterium]|nr:SpoIID/LytB domain-containing protein [Solirubrobacteraceae bacterium]
MPRLVLVGTLAIAALAAPQAAFGADRVWIEGRGDGHGIGLSQEGARGFAARGWGYRRILAHYYRGTSIGRLAPGRVVRVLLSSGGPASFSGASDVGGVALHPGQTYTAVGAPGGRIEVRSGSRAIARGGSPLQVRGSGVLNVAGGTYRGSVELTAVAGGVQVVNAVPLEEYVRGVVSAESPASWPMQELRAQAVAARGYAVTTSHGGGFDEYADTRSQVYRGVAAETARTDAAAQATAGQVVTYHGRAVTTYFFAASGGHTENVEDSFVGAKPEPWLKGVPDPYEHSPDHAWRRGPFTRAQLAAKLGDRVQGGFERVVVTQRGASPRIVHAVVVGTRGRRKVTGPDLKARLGLLDTWATFVDVSTVPAPAGPALAAGVGLGGGVQVRARAARAVRGTIAPGPRGTVVSVQREHRGRWHTIAATRLRSGGGYAALVPQVGTYRVRYRGLAGPAVRVR